MRRILIVANRTLGGDTLLDTVKQRLDEGPCECWVLVPVTSSAPTTPQRSPGGSVMPTARTTAAGPTAKDLASARRRLDEGLARLREAGADADGEVSAEPPLTAVDQCLAVRTFDEIILSTLPSGVSRWLGQGLPRRIRRHHRLPLTQIVTDVPEVPPLFRAPEARN